MDNYDERCFLLWSKNNMILLENMFGLILKDVVCDVVCLFFKDCCVLIIFKIIKGKFNYKINFIL